MKTLTVISPVYNEVETIEAFYKELKEVLSSIGYQSQILFILDKSTDGTLKKLKAIASNDSSVQILALSSRFGHQMSLLAGINHADADAVIMMDCDLQHPPQIIPQMIKAFEKGKEIVFTIRSNTEKIGFIKKLFSKVFYRFINLISDTHINENAADFRLISRRVLKILQREIQERNIFLRGIISWIGFEQASIPFNAPKRFAGKSKYSIGQQLKLGMNGIFSFSKKPLKAAILLGLFFASFAMIMGAITCIQYFFYQSIPSGWTTLVALLSGFSGIQLVFLGVVGEYIGNIFDEVKGRPRYLVEEKINFNE